MSLARHFPSWLYAITAGASLGALAWWLLDGWTTLAILMPFVLAAMKSRRDAFLFASAYQLSALVHWPSFDGYSLNAWGLWFCTGLSAGAIWALVFDGKGRALHIALRLSIAWVIAWATPFGWMGAAHPALGWPDAYGGLYLPAVPFWAGLLATLFCLYPFLYRAPLGAAKTPRLSNAQGVAVALIVIAVFTGGLKSDSALRKSMAGIAALQTQWDQSKISDAEKIKKVQETLVKMHQINLDFGTSSVAVLLVADAGTLPNSESDAGLFDTAQQNGIRLIVQHAHTSHWVFAVDHPKDGQSFCGSNWLPGWYTALSNAPPCHLRRLIELPAHVNTRSMQVHLLFPGDAISPAYWVYERSTAGAALVWALMARLDHQNPWAQRTIAKHVKALSRMTGDKSVAAIAN